MTSIERWTYLCVRTHPDPVSWADSILEELGAEGAICAAEYIALANSLYTDRK